MPEFKIYLKSNKYSGKNRNLVGFKFELHPENGNNCAIFIYPEYLSNWFKVDPNADIVLANISQIEKIMLLSQLIEKYKLSKKEEEKSINENKNEIVFLFLSYLELEMDFLKNGDLEIQNDYFVKGDRINWKKMSLNVPFYFEEKNEKYYFYDVQDFNVRIKKQESDFKMLYRNALIELKKYFKDSDSEELLDLSHLDKERVIYEFLENADLSSRLQKVGNLLKKYT